MKHVMLSIVRNVPVRDDSGKIVGQNQVETTKAMPELATLAEVAQVAFENGSNKVVAIFETPDK